MNPNIASSLKGGVSPSPGSKPPQQATAAPILDLFASDAPQATEAAPQAPSAADLVSFDPFSGRLEYLLAQTF